MSVCVCVCVCVRARARARVRVCELKQLSQHVTLCTCKATFMGLHTYKARTLWSPG